jgi:uncharacterized caspase-like protein
MERFLKVARLLCVCLSFGALLSYAAAETLIVAASRAKGRTGPDTPAAPARGFDAVSVRDRQGQQAVIYRASYALIIGVSSYANWPKLPGVLQDITAVAALFQAQGFQVEQMRDPTYDDLRRAFDNFINMHGQAEDHRLLIYFAGHGHTLKPKYGGDMGYIVPVDAPHPQRNEAGFRARTLSMQEIETYARRIQSKHVLFLFDSCFSGAIFSLSRAVPEYINYKTSQPVRQFITSGQADETVPDVSIFRQQLVAALQGEADKDGDGYVTGAELGEFLQQKVTNYSRNAQHPQYGKLRDPYLDKGDFVFTVARLAPQLSPPAAPSGLLSSPTQVQYRRALVIGNAKYAFGPLPTTTNDAEGIAAVLRDSHFHVDLQLDATRREMLDAMARFTENAQQGGVRLFYYAGYGLRSKGQDYIIPINAKISREEDLENEAISLARVYEATMDRGMTDTFIAYAASPGGIAMDGKGKYGVFTGMLLQEIRRPDLELHSMFKNVREGVRKITNGKQVPWIQSSTSKDFYFFPVKANNFESSDLNIIILDAERDNPFSR